MLCVLRQHAARSSDAPATRFEPSHIHYATLAPCAQVADLVKRRKCVLPPAVVQCLLGLPFSEIGSAEEFEGECMPEVLIEKSGLSFLQTG